MNNQEKEALQIIYREKVLYHVKKYTHEFVTESNKIERILREPSSKEIIAHDYILDLDEITVDSLISFVGVYEPTAMIRNKSDMNVNIDGHSPMVGGWKVESELKELLKSQKLLSPYEFHCRYEKLHPFTDCNGRTGRVIWAWMMVKQERGYPLGFLQHFYYQALSDHHNG